MISIILRNEFIPHFVYFELIYTTINGVAELVIFYLVFFFATPSTCTLKEWNFFSVHISIWLVFWGADPNVGAIDQPNDTRESPFVFENTFYFLLLIFCEIDISM